MAKDLNKRGIPAPRAKGWGKTGIRTILANEIYTGTFVWGRHSKRGLEPIRVENACPAIITREVFNDVQELFKERTPVRMHPKRASSRFLLSGLAFCGHCGKALTGQDAKSGKFSYYICGTLTKKGAGSCPAHYHNANTFENKVIKKIRDGILTEDNLKRLVDLVNEDLDVNSKQFRDELRLITEDTADTNRRLERLYEAVETGKIPLSDLAPRIHELKEKHAKLLERKASLESLVAQRRLELASPEIVGGFIRDMRKVLETSELTEKRAFVRSFVKDIQVIGDEAVLHYKAPLNGLIEEKMGVLPIVQYGGR